MVRLWASSNPATDERAVRSLVDGPPFGRLSDDNEQPDREETDLSDFHVRSSAGIAASITIVALLAPAHLKADATVPIEPTVRLEHGSAEDQDDLCFWRDETDPGRSVVITSDKKADLIAVYDLDGTLLQVASLPKP